MKNKRLAAILLVVFIDLLGFSLILPLLPYYADKYGASGAVTGLLVASYAVMQLIGAPTLGRLSDRYGRRPMLLLSVAGTSAGFFLLALADPIGRLLAGALAPSAASVFVIVVLFASRMLDGLTGGNLSVAQAYITDVTDERNRSKGLGMIGAAFGLGFIIGPAVGGLLSRWGYAVPAYAAAGLTLVNLSLIYAWLPESLSEARRAEIAAAPRAPFTLAALLAALRRPYSGSLLTTRFFFGLAFSMLQTIFALYALRRFNLTAQNTGFVLTYVGLLSIFVQGYLVGKLTARFREDLLISLAVGVMTVSLLGWAWAPSVGWLLAVLAPISASGGLLNTLLSSALTKAVHRDEVGGILGLGASLDSATRILAPILGGVLIERLGTAGPGLFGAAVMAGLSVFVWKAIWNHPIAVALASKARSAA
jgi:DHA1 family tetracycline resistance protein-like MFS transporter